MTKTSKDWVLLGASLAVLVGLGTILLLNRNQALFPEKLPVVAYDPSCNLQLGPCELELPGGKVRIDMAPRPVRPMRKFDITVKTEGQGIRAILVDFRGVSMNMGVNRISLKPGGADTYTAGAILPVCVRRRMDWEAQVWVDTPQGSLIAPFRFDTMKN